MSDEPGASLRGGVATRVLLPYPAATLPHDWRSARCMMRQWNRAVLGDVELEYLTQGAGEPIVLVHAGMFADWFDPLLREPSLAGYRVLSYHRIGYAGSSRPTGAV